MATQGRSDRESGTNGTVWHEAYPELGTGPIPIEPCVSAEYFELERERIYKRTWLNVGRVEHIPRPGAYFVKDLPVCDTSVILTRGRDAALQAFHNMCSHRGNKIVWDRRGSCQNFTCKFHGWSYGLNGSLNFWPLAPDRTLWEVKTYFPAARNAAQRFSQEYSKVLLREALLEDASTLEATQSMLASGAKKEFVLQDQELLVRHGHKVIEDMVGFYRARG